MERKYLHGTAMLQREAELPTERGEERRRQELEWGLPSAESVRDRMIPLFNRGRWRYSNSGTFMCAPFLQDMRQLGGQDVAFVGVPLDTGTTFRPGDALGPAGDARRLGARNGIQLRTWRRSH
ncbi:MAG: hypothetical protein KatS3mg059_1250 [Thermomicrobiales bacterium]|nr:MAG: hypothetical protein KatS3mg059_1250 [Thermomicrobiales bacterium]